MGLCQRSLSQAIAVVGCIGQQDLGRQALDEGVGLRRVALVAGGEREADRVAEAAPRLTFTNDDEPSAGLAAPGNGSRTLKVNEDEAELVRRIFADYLRLGSVHALQRHLANEGIRSKRRITTRGKVFGGSVFGRGALFHCLRNRIYRGMIVQKGKVHPGMHEAIVDEELFEAVQQSLDQQASRPRGKDGQIAPARLTGRIFDADGHFMCPTSARGRSGKLYRYYVSSPLQRGSTMERTSPRRPAAADLEEHISGILARVLAKPTANPLSLLTRVEIHADAIHLVMPQRHIGGMAGRLAECEHVATDSADPASLRLIVGISLLKSGAGIELQLGDRRGQRRDAPLIEALRTAHMMAQPGADGLPVLTTAPDSPCLRKLVRLAFLAPDLQRAMLDGHQPRALRLEHLMLGR